MIIVRLRFVLRILLAAAIVTYPSRALALLQSSLSAIGQPVTGSLGPLGMEHSVPLLSVKPETIAPERLFVDMHQSDESGTLHLVLGRSLIISTRTRLEKYI